MSTNRRRFLRWSAAAGVGVAQRGALGRVAQMPRARRSDRVAAPKRVSSRQVPASIRALRPMTAGIVPITVDERRARIEKARRLMAEQQHRRHRPRRRLEHVLLHRRALGPQRAAVRRGDSGEGRAGLGLPGVRGSAGARADQVRRNDVRTWQEDESPYRAGRADPQGPRRRDRPRRHRRARALLRRSTACARKRRRSTTSAPSRSPPAAA